MNIEDYNSLILPQIPQEACIIYNVLKNKNFNTYFVGGALRDLIINIILNNNKKIKDWDIATTARYIDLEKYFNKMLKINQNGKIVTKIGRVEILIPDIETTAVCINNKKFEITPLNKRYENGQVFVQNIIEDLRERDFTINSMAYNKDMGLIYKFKNKENEDIDCISDIKNKIIKCTDNPYEAISRNNFIILRALRFCLSLNFDIEKETLITMKENSFLLKNINKGKVFNEFQKILLCNNYEKIDYLFDLNILNSIYENWDNKYNNEIKELFLNLKNVENKIYIKIKYLYENFSNKIVMEELLKSFGVKKDIIFKIKEHYNYVHRVC